MPNSYDDPGIQYSQSGIPYDGTGGYQSPYPVAGVFVAFNDGPYVASPTWIEISTYVREITIHRGRSDDFEQFDTGTAQLVLDNRTRLFDPFYTSGTYYGKLTPRRQIRIVGQAGGTTYEVFRGYVAGWPVEWSQAGKDSTVTIQCFDALGLMANEVIPTDWYRYYLDFLQTYATNYDATTRYWKANDSGGTTTIRDQYGGVLSMVANTSDPNFFEQPALAEGLLGGSAACIDYIGTRTSTGANTEALFATVWVRAITQSSSTFGIFWESRTANIEIDYDGTTNTLRVYLRWDVNTEARLLTVTPQQNLALAVSHLVIAGTPGNISVYLNGQDIGGTVTSPLQVASANETVRVENAIIQEFYVTSGLLPGSSGTPTLATIAANLYAYGTGRLSETTTARMNRLIGTTSYPAALTSFTSSPVATVAEIGSGTGIIPEMQLVADSEGGEIYVSKAGALTTTNRTDVFTATRSAVSQATFTDSGAGLSYGPELLIEYDGDAQRNDVTVTFSGDGEVNQYNAYATSLYGGQATTIETQLADPTSATNLALIELGVEGSLIPRISPIDVSTNTAAASWQLILGLELLDRVTFKRTPTVGNQFDRDALINAIDHQIRPGVWNTQLTLSMRYTSPETLDDDVLGLLDLNYLG